jgi:aspartyl-tRNA(Asn)/glutamyl-tRNA(Gln) amidotransferase subunit A
MDTHSSPNSASELCALGVEELASLYRSRSISPVDVTRAVLDRTERLNPELNAYLAILSDQALSAARAAETQLAAGVDLGPLHGIPFSVKDIIHVAGTRTTAGSKVLLDAPIETRDAPVVSRLRSAGAVLIGKTNLHEFAFGAPDPSGPFGLVQNPRAIGHQPGSSSSGSAAAVAAGLGVFSIGTDTGGSIRHPASICGVVGLKPTQGLVPLRGIIPLSANLDSAGPIGRSVADVAAALSAVAGHDPDDRFSVSVPAVDYLAATRRNVRGLRLGLPSNVLYRFGLPAALELVDLARETLVQLGLVPIPLELPRAAEIDELYNVIVAVDLWVYHEHHQDKQALYGSDFTKRAELGRQIPAVQYAKALEAAAEIGRLWMDMFEQVDLVLMPANVIGAPLHGVGTVEIGGQQHPVRMGTSPFNRAANVTGLPALTVPAGQLSDGLPIGVQLLGPRFGEARLLAVGRALERALGDPVRAWGIEPQRP